MTLKEDSGYRISYRSGAFILFRLIRSFTGGSNFFSFFVAVSEVQDSFSTFLLHPKTKKAKIKTEYFFIYFFIKTPSAIKEYVVTGATILSIAA